MRELKVVISRYSSDDEDGGDHYDYDDDDIV